METQELFYRMAPHLLDSSVDEDGRIEFSDRRFVFFRTDMFAELFKRMEDQAGPVIHRKIQQFGVESGKEIGKKMDEDFESASPIESLKMIYYTGLSVSKLRRLVDTSPEAQFRKILGYGKYVGWFDGTELKEFSENEVRVRACNTFESASYGETGEKQCKYITGVLEGLMVHFWEEENLVSEELQCESEGHDHCVMRVQKDV